MNRLRDVVTVDAKIQSLHRPGATVESLRPVGSGSGFGSLIQTSLFGGNFHVEIINAHIILACTVTDRVNDRSLVVSSITRVIKLFQ